MSNAETEITRLTRRGPHWPWIISTLVLLVIGFFIAWNNGLRDRLFPRNFGVVEPGILFRSGQISAALIQPTLQNNHIKVIVALSANGMRARDLAAEKAAAQALGIDRSVFPLGGDGTGSLDHYADAVAAVDRAVREHHPVLVHCVAGAQRTGGVIALYQLLVEHRSQAQADAELRRYGHDPRENPRLIPFINQNMDALASRLVERGVLHHVPRPLPQLGSE